jgi:hypothetical protein
VLATKCYGVCLSKHGARADWLGKPRSALAPGLSGKALLRISCCLPPCLSSLRAQTKEKKPSVIVCRIEFGLSLPPLHLGPEDVEKGSLEVQQFYLVLGFPAANVISIQHGHADLAVHA